MGDRRGSGATMLREEVWRRLGDLLVLPLPSCVILANSPDIFFVLIVGTVGLDIWGEGNKDTKSP